MKAEFRIPILAGAVALAAGALYCAAQEQLRPDQLEKQGFVRLFNGSNLDGWRTKSTRWVVQDGVIYLSGSSDGQEHNDDYLWTEEVYGDFVLDLEYRTPREGANSGIFLRTSDLSDPVQTGLEVQVANARPDRPPNRGSVGGIYDIVAPSEIAHVNGEWNRYSITCRGPEVSVVLNGRLVSAVNLDEWAEMGKNPDGSPNKFTRSIKDFAREGHIGFQDHGRPVWYRNIWLKRLDK